MTSSWRMLPTCSPSAVAPPPRWLLLFHCHHYLCRHLCRLRVRRCHRRTFVGFLVHPFADDRHRLNGMRGLASSVMRARWTDGSSSWKMDPSRRFEANDETERARGWERPRRTDGTGGIEAAMVAAQARLAARQGLTGGGVGRGAIEEEEKAPVRKPGTMAHTPCP